VDAPRPELPGGFSPSTLRWIVVAAAVSFSAALLLTIFGRDLSRPPTATANSFSRSVLGYRGLAEFLAALDLGVVSRETRAALGSGSERPILLAEPDAALAAGDPTRRLLALLQESRAKRASLVLVLPKWTGTPLARRPDWVGALRLLPPAAVRRPLAALLAPSDVAPAEVVRVPPGAPLGCSWNARALDVELAPAQLLAEAPEMTPLVRCRGGALVARYPLALGSPDLFVVADPDLLNNRGLARGDHAAIVQALFVQVLGATGVVFDETIHGFERATSLVAELFRFPLALVLAQAAILLAIVLWAGAARFGKPAAAAAALPAGKQALIDNTAGLLAAGAERDPRGLRGHAADSLARYYRQTVRAVASELFVGSERGERETRERLQRISDGRRLGMNLAGLEFRVRNPEGSDLELARAIHRWRLEMTDGDRRDP
jgi:hypothetical protein